MAWNSAVPTSATVVCASIVNYTSNWTAIHAFCLSGHEDLTTSTPIHSAGAVGVLFVGTTSQVAALTPVPCAMAWDTTLKNFYTFTATTSSNRGGFVPNGTKMLFYADTAPTGWTLDNTLNDKLIFVTQGSVAGGQTGGGAHSTGSWTITGFDANVGNHTLTLAEMPLHGHVRSYHTRFYWPYPGGSPLNLTDYGTLLLEDTSSSIGGGGAHTHTMGAMFNDTGTATLSAGSGGALYTRTTGSFVVDKFLSGDKIIISGFSNGGNNGTKVIDTVAATSIKVTSATGMVDESGTGDERIQTVQTWRPAGYCYIICTKS